MTRTFPLAAALAGCLLLAAAGAPAQDRPRSETGRHRPEPVRPPVREQGDEAAAAAARAPWCLTFGFGMAGGSDLFNARTASGNPVTWPGAPFPTADFNAKLDNGFALAVGVGRRLGDRWTLRGEAGWSSLNVGAESAVGQVGDVFTYDTLHLWQLVLGAEARLVRQPSAPYVGLALLLQGMSATTADDLDQTRPGARVALGYEHAMNETTSLRLEGRLGVAGADFGDHAPTTQPPATVLIDGQDTLTIWQLLLGVQMDL